MSSMPRETMFQTPRGRIVVRSGWGLAGLAMAFWVASGIFAPQPSAEATATGPGAAFQQEAAVVREPDVAAPVPHPFKVGKFANEVQIVGAGTGSSLEELMPGSEHDTTEAEEALVGDAAAAFQRAVVAATAASRAVGTYSWRQSPDEWVASVPGASPELQAELLASATQVWPSLSSSKVDVVGEVKGSSPRQMLFDLESGVARIAVTVTQSVGARGLSEAVGQSTSYAVTMRLGGESRDQWVVTAITSS